MMSLWLPMLVLLLLAAAFMAWPLWRYRQSAVQSPLLEATELNARLVENVRLFREHLRELENNLAAQSIDAEQFAQLKLELERNLLEDEVSLRGSSSKASSFLGLKVAGIFSLVVLASSVLLYQKFGSADELGIYALMQQKTLLDNQDLEAGRNPDSLRAQALIAEYKARVLAEPENVQYWFLLARTHMEVGEYAQAVPAFKRVLEQDDKSSMIMAELAQAMFLRDNNQVTPPVVDLAKGALAIDPNNLMALGLLGINAFNSKDYQGAIQAWQKIVNLLGADSPTARTLLVGIERAKEMYIQEGGSPAELTAKPAHSLTVRVSLGDQAKVQPEQTVFIYARAWKGTPMPLAIFRLKVSDLPTTVTLDESLAMSPAASLANATDVEVVARVSSDGTAATKVGDWQAKQGPISMTAVPEEIQLTINEQVKAE